MQPGFQARDCCPICNTSRLRELCAIPYEAPRMADFLETFYAGRLPLDSLRGADYRVVVCDECEFVFQDPILDDHGMQQLYEHWIDAASSLRKKQQKEDKLSRQYRGQLQALDSLLDGPPVAQRLLEYGMGWGYWCRAAMQQGFDVSGYELSSVRRAHARGLGVRVIDELPPPGARYECIYSNQVFEHLPQPRKTLQELCARLAPGGLVYLRVPDGRGVGRTLARRGWSPELDAVHPLEHVNCFTRRSLVRLAADAGLQRIDPPWRLSRRHPWRSLKREIADRYLTTHLFFRYSG